LWKGEKMDINTTLFIGFETILRYLILFAESVYVLFAFIQSRQVKLMNSSFKTPQAGLFVLLAQIHLWATIIVFFFSLKSLL
jgi:hypothetical protein